MRAVNLVPEDERGGGRGRSGGAVYVLLGVLALLVLLVGVVTLQRGAVEDKRTELATAQATAAQREANAASLGSFTQFAALRATRVETVRSLASSRFDWSHSLREIARVIPADVWLTSLQGTVVPGVTLKSGGAAGTSVLRATSAAPAIEMVGCTTGQDSVARMLGRMRLIDGVSAASLQSSVKGAETATITAASGASAPSGTDDCRRGRARFPQFALVIFFDKATGSVPTTAAGGAPRIADPVSAALTSTTPKATP